MPSNDPPQLPDLDDLERASRLKAESLEYLAGHVGIINRRLRAAGVDVFARVPLTRTGWRKDDQDEGTWDRECYLCWAKIRKEWGLGLEYWTNGVRTQSVALLNGKPEYVALAQWHVGNLIAALTTEMGKRAKAAESTATYLRGVVKVLSTKPKPPANGASS